MILCSFSYPVLFFVIHFASSFRCVRLLYPCLFEDFVFFRFCFIHFTIVCVWTSLFLSIISFYFRGPRYYSFFFFLRHQRRKEEESRARVWPIFCSLFDASATWPRRPTPARDVCACWGGGWGERGLLTHAHLHACSKGRVLLAGEGIFVWAGDGEMVKYKLGGEIFFFFFDEFMGLVFLVLLSLYELID